MGRGLGGRVFRLLLFLAVMFSFLWARYSPFEPVKTDEEYIQHAASSMKKMAHNKRLFIFMASAPFSQRHFVYNLYCSVNYTTDLFILSPDSDMHKDATSIGLKSILMTNTTMTETIEKFGTRGAEAVPNLKLVAEQEDTNEATRNVVVG